VIRRRRGKGKVQEVDPDANVRSQSTISVIKSTAGVQGAGVHEMEGRRTDPIELPLNVSRSELDTVNGNRMSEKERRQWVDDRAAAGYEGAYRGN
jgi:hypothetical protein